MNVLFDFQRDIGWETRLCEEINRTKPPFKGVVFKAGFSHDLTLTIRLMLGKVTLDTKKIQVAAMRADAVKPLAMELCRQLVEKYKESNHDQDHLSQ